MSAFLRRRVVACVVVLAMLALPARPARADTLKTDAELVIVAIVAVTAAITVAIVLAVKHHPSVTGCVSQGPGGLTLVSEGDQTSLLLAGDTNGITPGDRIKVQGKKNGPAGNRRFVVDKVKKDFGACKVVTP